MDIRRFLKKRTLPDSPDTTAVSKVPRLAGDDSISTPMNSQERKDVGNDRSEYNNANPTQPEQSTSKLSSTTLSEDTEATQVSGSKGAITVRRYRGYSSFWQQRCHYCQKIQRLLKFLAAKVPLLSEDTEATQVSGSKGAITVRRYRGYSSFWQQRCHYCQKIQRLHKFLAAKVPLLSEDTEATQVSGSKGAITGKMLKFQPHWKKKYSLINYDSVTNGMLRPYCSHIYKEDREVLKHTQGAWISFPVSNWKKTLDKMKAHEASAWHRMAKAKVEAEKQSQAEGCVIL